MSRAPLPALLHDAPEYVIGDMISPFKAVLGGDYKVVEKRLLAAIHITLRPAGRAGGRDHPADLGRRPARGLSRGDASAGFGSRTSGCSAGIRDPEAAERTTDAWTAARAEKQLLERFKAVQ